MRMLLTAEEWTRLDALLLLASAHVAAVEAIGTAVAAIVDVRCGSAAHATVDQALFTGQTTTDLLTRLGIETTPARSDRGGV